MLIAVHNFSSTLANGAKLSWLWLTAATLFVLQHDANCMFEYIYLGGGARQLCLEERHLGLQGRQGGALSSGHSRRGRRWWHGVWCCSQDSHELCR